MEFDPARLPQPDCYKLLIGAIIPRPIAVVSTISPDGRANLAPFSFFAGVGSNPLTLLFCPANNNDGSEKDTLRNAKPESEGGTGQFIVNIACERNIRGVVASAQPLPYGESEFDLAGLGTAPGVKVRPPRLVDTPFAFECITLQVIRTNPGAPSGGNIVLGRVVYMHAADGLVNERLHTDPAKLAAVGRIGGFGYCTTRQRFELQPGRPALEAPLPEWLGA